MLYAQLDVNWPENPKRLRAGLEASAIHAICLCLAKRTDTDGWIDRLVLELYGGTDEIVDHLVALELLDKDGERVRPHDWHAVNLSSDAIRQKKSDQARAANHARWHDGPYATCGKCSHPPATVSDTPRSSEADPDQIPTGSVVIPEVKVEGMQQQTTDPPATTADRRQALLAAAAEIIGQRAADRPETRNPAAMLRSVAAGVIADRHQDAYAAIAADPSITAEDLAELLEPTADPPPPPPRNPSAQIPRVDQVMPQDDPDWELGTDAIRTMREAIPLFANGAGA